MLKRSLLVASLLVVLTATACGILQEPEAASGPIEAIPLEIETPAVAAEAETNSDEETAETGTEGSVGEEMATDDSAAAETGADMGGEAEESGNTAGTAVIFTISPDESQVRFELDEDLRGTRKTVVGTTNQIAGEIAADFSDLSAVQVGVIRINARTLVTDNDFRNRALNNNILETGAYEFITFTPTAVSGLPASANIGEEVTFTIVGDLTIRDITNEVTFTVVATAAGNDQLTGTASTIVNRAAFDLTIPSVPNVANVEEEVELYIDFVARTA